MIFASRRTWIEIDYIYDLLHGDDFREIPISTIMVGDLVIYKKSGQPTHVGVIVTIDRSFGLNIQVLSKWGKDGEFIHFINDVPELFGQAQEYWTDRPHETP